MSSKPKLSRSERRERRWNSKPLRGAIVGGTFIISAVFGVFLTPGTAGASPTVVAQGCTDTEIRNNMTCRGTTDPAITKAVLTTASGAALGAVGGPAGVVAGAAAGVVNAGIDWITSED